ncbi:MAG TPA: hypothetical protein VF283_07255 [Bryobacteraceae bacterium]
MNKYEQRAQQDRKKALRGAMMAATVGLILVAVAIMILGLGNSASLAFYQKVAIAIIILLLILRFVNRILKRKSKGPAHPDEKSQLKLH